MEALLQLQYHLSSTGIMFNVSKNRQTPFPPTHQPLTAVKGWAKQPVATCRASMKNWLENVLPLLDVNKASRHKLGRGKALKNSICHPQIIR